MDTATGNAGKARIGACVFDHVVAVFLGAIVAGNLPGLSNSARSAVFVPGFLGYFFLAEAIWAQTPGKALFGLEIRRLDGRRTGWKESAIR